MSNLRSGGNMGGGEELRALLSQTAITSNPFFYMVPLSGSDGSGASVTSKNAILQLKSQSYFLQTSFWFLNSGLFTDGSDFVDVYDASSHSHFYDQPSTYSGAAGPTRIGHSVFAGLVNDTLSACMTLPEYILWAPNSLIGVTWVGRNTAGDNKYRYVVLGGIEYHMEN